jgi:probable phosphoglycerate mutase
MRLIVEADGGSRGNPGPAAFGAVVRDPETGQALAERAGYIGTATNNVAEYQGLIAGLTAAREIDPDVVVEARLDSKLVVEQMSGRWKIKHPSMRPLALEAQRILPVDRVTYVWVPREKNKHADRLANEALDAAARGEEWSQIASTAELAAGDPTAADDLFGGPARLDTVVDEAEVEPPPTDLATVDTWDIGLGAPTTTLLLRHGVTRHTLEKRFCGVGGADPELTELGVRQAKAAARRLAAGHIDFVVSSPMRRARETAAVVADSLGLTVQVVEGLAECAFGEWEGLTFAEVRDRWPDRLLAWFQDPALAPPGGESLVAVRERVAAARAELLEAHAGRTMLVVSHVTPIKLTVLDALASPIATLHRMEMVPASLTEVRWYDGGMASMLRFNDIAHL